MEKCTLKATGSFLYTFACVGKHMSFTRAAEELCVTQSAVSHRIKCLEEQLEFPLFHRLTRKIAFTKEGEQLYEVFVSSLHQIEEEIRNIRGAELRGNLIVSCAPSIAGCWLLPRLPRFRALYPSISLHLRSSNDLVDFETESVDIAIYCGSRSHLGLHATPLLQDNLLPVCSPEYALEHRLQENPLSLRHCTLIHEAQNLPNVTYSAGWQTWGEWAGLTGLPLQGGYSFDRAELTAIAAKEGLGVALGREWLVREAINNGKLVVPFNLIFPAPQSYFVVSTQEGVGRAKVRAFSEWILSESRLCAMPY